VIVQFQLDEKLVKPAYLKTLYDLIEELNCRSETWLEESYSQERRKYCKNRVVQVSGSNTMVSWLLLRMQRYKHLVDKFSDGNSIVCCYEEDDD